MNLLSLSLLVSKTVIQAAIILSFTCVLRCHSISPKGKVRNLMISNLVVGVYILAYWFSNTNVHRLLKSVQLPSYALPKRLSIIFLWAEFSIRGPIYIVNIVLYTFCIVECKWGAHSYWTSPKITRKHIAFVISFYPCADVFTI